MPTILLLAICLSVGLCACTQNTSSKTADNRLSSDLRVGGNCEGCEAVYDSPFSFSGLNGVDTLPDFNEEGPKLRVSGTIYQPDGKTPAKGVVLYIYHTDQQGNYSNKPGNSRNGGQTASQRHGYIRGWIKTGDDGKYEFYTLVPASYPNSNNPKHIHPIIKEPGKIEYWIDEYVFADDPLLPKEEMNRTAPVGGSGLLKPEMKNGMLEAKRDIILGQNVKDYPKPARK
jgi:protocatechuate 3,4-dioxygenase beta subunit